MVATAAGILFVVWSVSNYGRITADDNGVILFVLGVLFSVLILFRRKPDNAVRLEPWRWLPALGVAGALLVVFGLIFRVHQFQWLGLILILYACLRWSLPARYGGDVRLSLFLLYWANPLPGQVVGRLLVGMQWFSIKGAEWALHCLNARIWADGFVLQTGLMQFGVPEACSGMRTATTVFVCLLGVSVLLRFKWYETVPFVVLGILQVLFLNIIRITTMVLLAPRMPPEWGENFLHDTVAVFLLIAIMLTQAEALWWKNWVSRRRYIRDGIRRGELEAPDKATILPPAWRRGLKWGRVILGVLILVLGITFVFYKHRPSHRAAMIEGTLEGLLQSDSSAATRAVQAALWLNPDRRELKSMQARIFVTKGDFSEALGVYTGLESEKPLNVEENVMKSWSLMALGRPKEAIAVVDALPASARRLPGVAMIRAEYAAAQKRPDEVAQQLLLVGRSHLFAARVRNLFLYLAQHEQWEVVVQVDSQHRYGDVRHALISVHAHLVTGDLAGAGSVMRRAADIWGDDVRFLGYLFVLALGEPGGGWEDLLSSNLRKNLGLLGVDELATYLAQCFRLGRVDLAWMTFARLSNLDSDDPALHLVVAQYAAQWFVLRKHVLGIEDERVEARMDVRPLYHLFGNMDVLLPLWRCLPMASELASGDIRKLQRTHLKHCLEELDEREEKGTLPERLELTYISALAALRRYSEAHRRIEQVAKQYPLRRLQMMLQAAALYHAEGRWEETYESLRNYFNLSDTPSLRAGLLQVNAIMSMGYGAYALHRVETFRALFPDNLELDRIEAAIWDVFGFKERALHLLTRREEVLDSRAAVQMLYETGRIKEAEVQGLRLGVEIDRQREKALQRLAPLPAEFAVERRWPKPFTQAEMAREAQKCQEKAAKAVSPFVAEIEALAARWYAAGGGLEVSRLDDWENRGRNPDEKAALLKRLTMLQARQEQVPGAQEAVKRALVLTPRSVMLWRIAVALSEGDLDLVNKACGLHPGDSQLWLAALISRYRKEGAGDWLKGFIGDAIADNRFDSEAYVSAADFLLRQKELVPASILIKHAIPQSRGLLSAYGVGLRCALASKDLKWAQSCALAGIENAQDPVPFYRVLVLTKGTQKERDADLLKALEYLHEHVPRERLWGEMLGQSYFEKGDPRRAMTIFSEIMSKDIKGVTVKSLLMAAEAARLEGKEGTAVGLLEAAHNMYPEKVNILNNLIYNLAQNKETVHRAKQLLPGLLEMADESFAILDTAALVHLRAGEVERAGEYMSRALGLLQEDDYGALESRLSAAEIEFRLGRTERARAHLEVIRAAPDVSELVEIESKELLQRIRATERNE